MKIVMDKSFLSADLKLRRLGTRVSKNLPSNFLDIFHSKVFFWKKGLDIKGPRVMEVKTKKVVF